LASLPPSLYSTLFTRLVTSPMAPIRLGRREIPLRLSDHRLAPLDRWRASLHDLAHRKLRGRLGIRPFVNMQLARMTRRSARLAAAGRNEALSRRRSD
jgi:hypothetical protein